MRIKSRKVFVAFVFIAVGFSQLSYSIIDLNVFIFCLSVIIWVKIYRPLNTKFVGKHAKIRTPRTFCSEVKCKVGTITSTILPVDVARCRLTERCFMRVKHQFFAFFLRGISLNVRPMLVLRLFQATFVVQVPAPPPSWTTL